MRGSSGNFVKIKHSKRYTTSYSHLHRVDKGLKVGTRVKKGQVIGTVGSTGRATGAHLHYSFYDNGKYVDPLKVKLPFVDSLTDGQKINQAYLQKVLKRLEDYLAQSV